MGAVLWHMHGDQTTSCRNPKESDRHESMKTTAPVHQGTMK